MVRFHQVQERKPRWYDYLIVLGVVLLLAASIFWSAKILFSALWCIFVGACAYNYNEKKGSK